MEKKTNDLHARKKTQKQEQTYVHRVCETTVDKTDYVFRDHVCAMIR